MNDYRELRDALAAGPPEGPWRAVGRGHRRDWLVYSNTVPSLRAHHISETDARYIAAADPTTIRQLLADLDSARADAARWKWARYNPGWLGWDQDYLPAQIDVAIDAAMKEQQ